MFQVELQRGSCETRGQERPLSSVRQGGVPRHRQRGGPKQHPHHQAEGESCGADPRCFC